MTIEDILRGEIGSLNARIAIAESDALAAQTDSWYEGYSSGRVNGMRTGLNALLEVQDHMGQTAECREDLIDSLRSKLENAITQRRSEDNAMSPEYWSGQIDMLFATLRRMGEYVEHPDF